MNINITYECKFLHEKIVGRKNRNILQNVYPPHPISPKHGLFPVLFSLQKTKTQWDRINMIWGKMYKFIFRRNLKRIRTKPIDIIITKMPYFLFCI